MNNRVDKGSRLCARHSRESLRKSHSCSIGLSSNSLDYDTHQLELIHFDSTSTPGNAVRPSDTLQSLSAAHFSSPSLPIRPLIDTSGRETEGTDLLSVGLSTTASQPQFAHVHHMTCTHFGVALTCLGFLDYNGTAASNSRAFRVLGIVALILCIGFLIAACVIVSECLTAAMKHSSEEGYHALYPTFGTSFHSSNFNYSEHISSPPTEFVCENGVNPSATSFHSLRESGIHLHPCPSCSCSNLRQSLSYPENVRLPPSNSLPAEKQLVVTEDKRDYLTPVYINNATNLLDDPIEDEDGFDEVSQWV